MSETILKVENVSKQYRLGTLGTGTISHDLNRWWASIRGKEDPYLKVGETNDRSTKATSEYVWALKDINFEVKRGEVLGIIGKNGAGKSTLLKILSKVTGPSTGSIKSRGRIASLLEVGTGFHPEMTGRENVYLNGAILGMTKKEINAKIDEIIEFSGCERFIDTPTKRYSSGMTVRLAFAVAAFLEPDILIVDEVLAVGDAEFQKKAIGKMQDISSEGGRTVLFVSHNMAAVRSLCTRAIVLGNGEVVYIGGTNDAVDHYLNMDTHQVASIIEGINHQSKDILIESISINKQCKNVVYVDEQHSELNVNIKGELLTSKIMDLEVRFYDEKENLQMLYAPGHLNGELINYKKGVFEINEVIKLPNSLTKQELLLDVDITHPNIEFIVKISKHVKVISKGIVGKTGSDFSFKNYGFMVLK
ncbi:ABC transporter ATP-binding protein [Polaribacter undariae]|uniref:ABC transporter ATP-binding protein n=1 Tax=Polaribacter sejongensis TaxID=985043 RepID=A0AAJ1QWN0_9FLAO|nr:ABC transporter ATP-binding protein [Polaribacter undariae]MDN3618946.1 ABC transporter ATP-binding protein [Polaribacter undariae]UWD33034.1 ABC transporter ATP-binding protein [Polaribacter undariae]